MVGCWNNRRSNSSRGPCANEYSLVSRVCKLGIVERSFEVQFRNNLVSRDSIHWWWKGSLPSQKQGFCDWVGTCMLSIPRLDKNEQDNLYFGRRNGACSFSEIVRQAHSVPLYTNNPTTPPIPDIPALTKFIHFHRVNSPSTSPGCVFSRILASSAMAISL